MQPGEYKQLTKDLTRARSRDSAQVFSKLTRLVDVVSGQRLMQAASDIFLGWQRVPEHDGKERDYYVRQFRDWKWSPDVSSLPASAIKIWGRLCAWTLAHGHARSGDCIAIAAYLGQGDTFDRAMASFAEAYADQNESDYVVFRKAVRAGRLTAVTGA